MRDNCLTVHEKNIIKKIKTQPAKKYTPQHKNNKHVFMLQSPLILNLASQEISIKKKSTHIKNIVTEWKFLRWYWSFLRNNLDYIVDIVYLDSIQAKWI